MDSEIEYKMHMSDLENRQTTERGLFYGRVAGQTFGIFLLLWAFKLFVLETNIGTFDTIKASYFLIYGCILNLPFKKLPTHLWKISFAALSILSAGFVFVMVVSVMFAYMEMAEIGERLGVPGFEGTLVFLSLLQPPVVLFQNKPDLLD